MFKKAMENSDNKVQIAMQMYEMVSLSFLHTHLHSNSCFNSGTPEGDRIHSWLLGMVIQVTS